MPLNTRQFGRWFFLVSLAVLPMAGVGDLGGPLLAYDDVTPQPIPQRARAQRLRRAGAAPVMPVPMESPATVRDEPAEPGAKPSQLAPGEILLHVHLTDGGLLTMKLRAKKIPIITAYGRLEIPVEDIHAIELAPRLTDEVAKRVKAAVLRLASSKVEERAAAGPELFNLREKAFIALVRASKSKDKDLAKRANDLVEDLRGLVPPEFLEYRDQDTIETDDSRFAGDVDLSALEVTSPQFGSLELKLVDVRSIAVDTGGTQAIDLQGNLSRYQHQVGKTLSLRVTGTIRGVVWGDGIYAIDSTVGAAAVHAGRLRNGQTGVVRVRILHPQQLYTGGSYRNGVNSQPTQMMQNNSARGAFQFVN